MDRHSRRLAVESADEADPAVALWREGHDREPLWSGQLSNLEAALRDQLSERRIWELLGDVRAGKVFHQKPQNGQPAFRVEPHIKRSIEPSSPVVRYGANRSGRDFVVGDIHGHFDAVRQWLQSIGFDEGADRLFAVGDLIDRGPQSDEVAWWLHQPWFASIRGNHEVMMLQALRQPSVAKRDQWFLNGGSWWNQVDPEQAQIIESAVLALPYAIEIQGQTALPHGILHGDFPAEHDVWDRLSNELRASKSNHTANSTIWGRGLVASLKRGERPHIEGLATLFIGHTTLDAPLSAGNVSAIDTGLGASKALTFFEVASGRRSSIPIITFPPPLK